MRIGIVGLGIIGSEAHLPAVLSTQGATLTCLIDTDTERVGKRCEQLGISPHISSSLDDLATRADAVIIATPNDTHKNLAISCLELGLHVLVEKPLACTVADAKAIKAAAQKRFLMAGFCLRYFPAVQIVRRMIQSQELGPARRFVCQWGAAGGLTPYSQYTRDPGKVGGGTLVINGSHYLDRILWWFGYPTSFKYCDDADGGPEANCVAEFSYDEAQVKGVLRLSKTTPITPGSVVEFEHGTVIVRDWQSPSLSFVPATQHELCFRLTGELADWDAGPNEFQRQLREFVDACQHGAGCQPQKCGVLTSVDDAIAGIQLTEALYACREPLPRDWFLGGVQ